MALSDYTDVVAWFSDEAAAEVFAKFLASEGMPCHITGIRKATHFEQYGVRVHSNRIDELRQILRLKPVANAMTPIAAQSMGRRLARAGIPCCVAEEHGSPSAASATALCGMREIGHIVAVPESFLGQAVRILNVTPPSNTELTEIELALKTLPDSTHPH
ncbi:MAG TPA: hypothetical protein VGG67_00805 [Steroidobacteraceae bacterium]|jgi:hypothetical protein